MFSHHNLPKGKCTSAYGLPSFLLLSIMLLNGRHRGILHQANGSKQCPAFQSYHVNLQQADCDTHSTVCLQHLVIALSSKSRALSSSIVLNPSMNPVISWSRSSLVSGTGWRIRLGCDGAAGVLAVPLAFFLGSASFFSSLRFAGFSCLGSWVCFFFLAVCSVFSVVFALVSCPSFNSYKLFWFS